MRERRSMGQAGGAVLVAAALLTSVSAAAVWPSAASAEGAIAVGQPADVATQGFAYGMVGDLSTTDQASSRALKSCQTAKGASDSAKAACKVIQTLHEQCAAVAIDPAKGTPGVGWAVADVKKAAETQALQKCHDTAGDRASYCKIAGSICDANMYRQNSGGDHS